MPHQSAPALPRLPLIGAAALIAFSITAVAAARLTGLGSGGEAGAALVARDLHFLDRQDGGVAVVDARSARPIEVIEPGTNGFMRSTLRGLARERKRQEVGPEAPFRLTAWADGRLTLEDPATGRRIGLEAFGATNAQAVARLLTMETRTQ